MKTIKVILLIIIVFSTLFFATGLIVKETKYTTSVKVNKPIEFVFSSFENPDLFKEWLPDIKSIETVVEKPGKLGSEYLLTVTAEELEIPIHQNVLAYVQNEKMTFQFDSEVMLKTDDFIFTPVDGGTQITQNSTVKSKSYIMGCVFPYFKGKLEDKSQQYLDKFKEVLENK